MIAPARRRALLGILAVAAAAATSSAGEPTNGYRVAIISDRDDATARRLAAELRAIGFVVSRVTGPHARGEQALIDTAHRLGADGAVEADADDLLVYVREASGRTFVEHAGTPADSATAIPRATELLRTRVLPAAPAAAETPAAISSLPVPSPPSLPSSSPSSSPTLPSSAPPPRPPPRPPAIAPPRSVTSSNDNRAVPAPASTSSPFVQREPAFGGWLGAGEVSSGGAAGSALYAMGGGFLRLLGPVRLDAMLGRSVTGTGVVASEGQTSVDTWLAAVDARARVAFGRFGASGGLGVGGAWLHLQGTASRPFTSGHDDIWTTWPFAVIGADAALTHALAVRVDGMAGFTAPKAVIAFAGSQVASWGVPLTAATFGIELHDE